LVCRPLAYGPRCSDPRSAKRGVGLWAKNRRPDARLGVTRAYATDWQGTDRNVTGLFAPEEASSRAPRESGLRHITEIVRQPRKRHGHVSHQQSSWKAAGDAIQVSVVCALPDGHLTQKRHFGPLNGSFGGRIERAALNDSGAIVASAKIICQFILFE
jgi:hypothetical protein